VDTDCDEGPFAADVVVQLLLEVDDGVVNVLGRSKIIRFKVSCDLL